MKPLLEERLRRAKPPSLAKHHKGDNYLQKLPPSCSRHTLNSYQTGSFTDSVNTADATLEVGEPVISTCTFDEFSATVKTVWYGLTITAGTEVSASTAGSDYDTILVAYTGASLNALSEAACHDDVNNPDDLTSLMEFTASSSTTYWIQVGGVPLSGGDSGNLELDVTVTPPGADLSVSVSDSPDPASLGGTFVYTVTVANAGPVTATAAELTGGGLGVVSITASQGSCTVGGPNVTCPLGTIAASASATVTITMAPTSTSTVNYVFRVGNPDQPDPNVGNDSHFESTTVNNALGCTITGTNAGETLNGTNAADVICALGGNDTIDGGNGNDTIYAGAGNDTLVGGNSNDTLYGQAGDDNTYGESLLGSLLHLFDNGTDTIDGGPGNDDLDGQNGNDTLTDLNGTDTMSGNLGNDTINVQDGAGGDSANGGLGSDTCTVDAGDTATLC